MGPPGQAGAGAAAGSNWWLREGKMQQDVFTLGLELTAPWKVVGQALDDKQKPFRLTLEVSAERGATFPCPACEAACKAHDWKTKTWRHLNFFQHHCYITARVPRVKCRTMGFFGSAYPGLGRTAASPCCSSRRPWL